MGSILGSRRSPGEANGHPVFFNGESRGQGSWQATVHGVAELDTTEKITLSLSSGNVHWGLIMCQVLGKALHITAFNFHSFLRQ